MNDMNRAPEALGLLIFEVLRTAAALDERGAELVAPLGLTPARWQVLSTLNFLESPETVSGLARRLSLTRQSVQRVVNDLEAAGLVEMRNNPSDRRAQLATPTTSGRKLAQDADALRRPWTAQLAQGLNDEQLRTAVECLAKLRNRLDGARQTPTEGFQPIRDKKGKT